ncbi:MAG: DUF1569 domain-containing protein [Planctomycetes bacterium]|nr:DUF1569 domain-containing protein [Planctomycetota bacterium]
MTSRSLFVAADRQEMLARVARLTASTKPAWGKLNVAQMCAHCQAPLNVALGELRLKRGLIGILFGGLAKKKLLSPEPWKPGLPTAPEFRVVDPRDFAREHRALTELVRRFGEGGPSKLTQEPHPFFGPLTVEQWSELQWRHLDHHLRQFGV